MINEYAEIIANCFKNKPVKRAFLIGSAIRSEQDEQSDVDILVELEDLLKRKVDILTSKSVSKYIQPFIDSEKILIYVRYLWR